jgi:hypothetical protein
MRVEKLLQTEAAVVIIEKQFIGQVNAHNFFYFSCWSEQIRRKFMNPTALTEHKGRLKEFELTLSFSMLFSSQNFLSNIE